MHLFPLVLQVLSHCNILKEKWVVKYVFTLKFRLPELLKLSISEPDIPYFENNLKRKLPLNLNIKFIHFVKWVTSVRVISQWQQCRICTWGYNLMHVKIIKQFIYHFFKCTNRILIYIFLFNIKINILKGILTVKLLVFRLCDGCLENDLLYRGQEINIIRPSQPNCSKIREAILGKESDLHSSVKSQFLSNNPQKRVYCLQYLSYLVSPRGQTLEK